MKYALSSPILSAICENLKELLLKLFENLKLGKINSECEDQKEFVVFFLLLQVFWWFEVKVKREFTESSFLKTEIFEYKQIQNAIIQLRPERLLIHSCSR